jgi:Immunity protein 7
MVKGTVLAESLRVGAELSVPGLRLARVSRRDMSTSVTAAQPPVWTFLEFEAGDDVADELAASLARSLSESAGIANETVDLRVANGQFHLWLAGFHNHLDPTIVRLYKAIAATAPGSYGILYTRDDDVSNSWDRWVMRRGEVHREQDQDLSPHVGLVEDAE